MSHADRNPRSIPARPSGPTSAPALSTAPSEADAPSIGSRRHTARRHSAGLAWRALRRHRWPALLAWLAGSMALMALAYHRIRPTYEASSTIRVDPVDRGPSLEGSPAVAFESFKETQVQRITNPDVIDAALAAHPELLHLPRLARARDPGAEARKSLAVMLIPRTNLIRVSMATESAGEAAWVVNAVIEAYLKVALDADEEGEGRRRKLREAKEERAVAVRKGRDAVASLVGRIGAVGGGRARDRDTSTIGQYGVLTRELLQADLELVEARARLEQLRAEPTASTAGSPSKPDAATISAFYANPRVVEARARLDRAVDGLAQAERIARSPSDPARVAAGEEVVDNQRRIDALWAEMGPALARANRPGAALEGELRAAGIRVAGLEARLDRLNGRLERLNIQARSAGADELALEFARQDLARAEAVLDTVTGGLDRAEFEARGPLARVRQEYQARASDSPDSDARLGVMAAAPAGLFLGILGLLVLAEARAGRVHDPEELPARLNLPVLGVVPPLPGPRAVDGAGRPSTRDSARSRRELDQFLQGLDYTRVAIGSGRDARGRPRRSILITSARGGEGKTTLAAQLAERCVNAGLVTLLVDADLRNPTLSRMFDLPAARGLVDVLRGEAMAEEAITVIGAAGGLHFLPAGSPRVDPGRLLQGGRLSRLLAGAREGFDMVIVDAPPVLPVPDALTIGRWVDGAVLAVRFDDSRYPLVELANRRLAAVGVPVLGAVINGVRGAGAAYYGPYDPSYGSLDDDGHPGPAG